MARALPPVLVAGRYTTGNRGGQPGSASKRSEGHSRKPPSRGRQKFRPAVEALEPRLVPALSFAAQQTFAAGTNPDALAVADFNGDGKPDFAVANGGDKAVSVFLNTTTSGAATASFAAQQTFASGNSSATFGTVSVAVGDFNGDGRPDLAAANYGSDTVSVLLNTTASGTLSFAAQQTFAVGVGPAWVAVADLNGDGRPDLAVANSSVGTVSVFLNTTPPGASAVSFAAQQTFAVSGRPGYLAVADLNDDGRPDLVTGNYTGNNISVLLNTTTAGATTPSFAAQQTFAAGGGAQGVAAADLNGDGRPDLAVANYFDRTVSVYMNTMAAGATTPSFTAQQTFAAGANPIFVAAEDLDGDGRPDLAVANSGATTVSVLLNTAAAGASAPSFAAQQTFTAGNQPYGVAAGDFNTDGRPDLASANNTSNNISVLLNTTAPFARGIPVVVGQFGSSGVWELNRSLGTWVQLTPANASLLAADALGDVVGVFPGYGVQEYKPSSGWAQINGIDATVLTMNAHGVVVAQFPGFGVGEFIPAFGWRSLTGANAALLDIDDNGDVAGEFPGYGVQLFRPATGWQQINGVDASLLAISPQGDVVANFHGVGVGEYSLATGWHLLNGTQATALAIDRYGDVTAQFAGVGVGEYVPAFGWRLLTGANASLLRFDSLGDVIGEFPGFGVWEFDASRGWFQLTGADATFLATG
jgi:hypothetical protein